ncbi:hypothetical protein T265_08157 [Opisthorchis viverrini]|uniref:Uncharacterized protein n=1 Tax=Opisthorchis viverrini TaxID=6198 RepID=A0A074ZA32_OPIVI|nr:hypothetical protein T265_08157 [Opisthorchis viverrini]KER24116.1 hypothetical protein T265_08157 [Opisthorchis viverrini]
MKETTHKVAENSSTAHDRFRPSWGSSACSIIIIIDSMTSVFNTDASLPYNHDLFESFIVKKRVKVERGGT